MRRWGNNLAITVGGPDEDFSGLGGALNNSGGDSTLSCGTSIVTAEPCDADADICESQVMSVPVAGGAPTILTSGLTYPGGMTMDATAIYG